MVSTPAGEPSQPATSARGDTDITQAPASRGQNMTSKVRKEQNKNASRVYRERRKQRLALLERLLEKERTQKDSQGPQNTAPEVCCSTNPTISDAHPVFQTVAPEHISDSAAGALAPSVFGDMSLGSPWTIEQDDSIFSMAFFQPNFSAQPPSSSSSEMVAPLYPTINEPSSALQLAPSQPAILHGSSSPFHKSSSSMQNNEKPDESLQSFFNKLMSVSVPDVKQVIYVQQNGLFGAIMENTLALGLLRGAQILFSQDGTSPFNKDWIESKGAMQLSEIKSKFATVPKDLQPLDIQITFEHHVYLDVMPFPLFRSKALQALMCDPPLFDEDELCVDITDNAGLVIWGSQGNDQGMEACRPWDMRSWEPKPWFLRKYWYLCGGWEDEMWKAARWWHAVRNEKISSRPADLPTSI